jgi:hypothetical protein
MAQIPVRISLRPQRVRRVKRNPNKVQSRNLTNVKIVKNSVDPTQYRLQLGLFNARSINNKALFIKQYAVDNHFDLLAITETWTKSD